MSLSLSVSLISKFLLKSSNIFSILSFSSSNNAGISTSFVLKIWSLNNSNSSFTSSIWFFRSSFSFSCNFINSSLFIIEDFIFSKEPLKSSLISDKFEFKSLICSDKVSLIFSIISDKSLIFSSLPLWSSNIARTFSLFEINLSACSLNLSSTLSFNDANSSLRSSNVKPILSLTSNAVSDITFSACFLILDKYFKSFLLLFFLISDKIFENPLYRVLKELFKSSFKRSTSSSILKEALFKYSSI